MKRFFLFLLALMMLTTGCAARGTEEQLMVVSLGIDQEDDDIVITAKMPGFTGKSSEGAAGENSYLTLSARGKNISEALNHLRIATPRTLNFTQTRQILLSENLHISFADAVKILSRIDGIRSQALLAIARGSAKEIMEAQKAIVGTRLSRYIDTTLATAVQRGSIPDSTLVCALNSTCDPYQDILLAVVSKNPAADSSEKEVPAFAPQAENTNEKEHSSGNPVDYAGSAAMDGDHIAAFLSDSDTALCRFLLRKVSSLYLPTSQGFVTLTSRTGPFFDLKDSKGHVTLSIKANFNVLPQFGAETDPDAMQDEIQRKIIQFMNTLQDLGCDALGFGGIAVRRFSTLEEWENYPWKTLYRQAPIEVKVTLTLMDES